MKRLFSLLFSVLTLVGCATNPKIVKNEVSAQGEVMKNLGIPFSFQDYQTKGVITFFGPINAFEGLFHAINYDINQDGKDEVGELYAITESINEGMRVTKNPFIYAFDFNRNNQFDEEEILVDRNIDGLNGNEEWYFRKELSYVL